jgi:hypothetical protein
VSGGASVAGNLYVETNARIKGFMSVNGNTGIYGNVVLTSKTSVQTVTVQSSTFRSSDTGLIVTGGWVWW